MIILEQKYTIKELNQIYSFANGFVKGVVDLSRNQLHLMQTCIMNWQII